ncbi:MAG: hypothetical protein IJO64_02235 [Clostridia bacterium]|nr:hypothetical protein [Clostridia bacterium]
MQLKRILAILLAAALTLSASAFAVFAEENEILKVGVVAESAAPISVSPVVIAQGEEISVRISIEENTGVNFLSFFVYYNADAFEYVDHKSEKLFGVSDSLKIFDAKESVGKLKYVVTLNDEPSDAVGTLAVINFKAKETFCGNFEITVDTNGSKNCIKYVGTSGHEEVPFEANGLSIDLHAVNAEEGVVTDPTCLDEGYTTYTCSACGEAVKGNTVAALGHDYVPVVTDPTCTEIGYTTHTCSRCEDSYVDSEVEALGHVLGPDATCTEDQTCIVCGEILNASTGHIPGKEADCVNDQTCLVCGEVLVEALGHDYESVVTDPTCTEGGYTTHTCKVCGDVVVDSEVEALGHTAGAEATCTEDQICTVCGVVLEEAFGHTAGDEATCIDDQICNICGEVLTEKLGHYYRDTVTEPTCTEQGYTTHVCARCEDTYVDAYVDALGHTAGAEATCTEDQTCTVCGEVLVAALGHDYESVVTEPTCTEEGYTTHTCARCGDSYVDTKVEALGHTEGEWVTVTEPEYGVEGKKEMTCTVCGEVIATESIPALTYRIGDVNMNGEIDVQDYSLAKRACLKTLTLTDEQFKLADVNGNGVVDINDYALIKRHKLKTYDLYA